MDLNNISPDTKNQISDICENFVDGAIIGKIDSQNPTLFLSGKNADKLLFLKDFINVKVISYNVGDASKLNALLETYDSLIARLEVIGDLELQQIEGFGKESEDG